MDIMRTQRMFDQANGFYIVATLCKKEIDRQAIRFDMFSNPEIVNLALACEIYLKTLIYIFSDEEIKGHKFNELIDKLPSEERDKLLESLYNKYPYSKDIWGRLYLDKYSDVFTVWRYCYEKNKLHCETGFLIAFADELKEECSQRIYGISWEEYRRANLEL